MGVVLGCQRLLLVLFILKVEGNFEEKKWAQKMQKRLFAFSVKGSVDASSLSESFGAYQIYLDKEWDIFIHPIFRERNFCADILAKLGVNHLEFLVMVHQPLPCLSWALLIDVMRVSFIRI